MEEEHGSEEEIERELESEMEMVSRLRVDIFCEYDTELMQAMVELKIVYKVEHDNMMARLAEVQRELREIKQIRDEDKNNPPPKKDMVYSCYFAGKPYFKDANFNQPPPNEDTRIMKQCDMYDFSTVMTVSGWNYGDTSNLQRVLLKMAQKKEKARLYSQLHLLQRIQTDGPNKMIRDKISDLMDKITSVSSRKLTDLDPSSYEEFDWDDVALELNCHDRRHSAREYKTIWKLLLHPSVKMDKWSASEHVELQQLAREYNMQNWNAIAKDLNTRRTGYQCFVYYRTNMDHAASGRKWTVDEMDRLRDIISTHQEENHIPWGKVAALMPNRTKVQCYNKFSRMMENRKGRFTEEEDAVILNYVNVFDANYKNMVQFMYGRSSVQCRNRHALLKRTGPSATWTEEDDQKLLMAIANSDGPRTFSAACKFFGNGKERTHLRSRYYTLKRWIKKHPHSPTRNAPRRAPRRLAHGEPTTNLITALQNLRKRINYLSDKPQREVKPKTNRLCRSSSDAHISSALRTQILTHRRQLSHQANLAKESIFMRNMMSPRVTALDVYHLNLLLYLLNTRIVDRAAFHQSQYGQGFSELEEMKLDTVPSVHVVKSYSKKGGSSNVEPFVKPNLYSGNTAGRRRFLLPPNLDTLTGSRSVLTYVHRYFLRLNAHPNPPQPFDLKRSLRRKATAFIGIIKLRERFNDLFVWPHNLSNNSPRYYSQLSEVDLKLRAVVRAERDTKIRLPNVPPVTIPSPWGKTRPKRTRISNWQRNPLPTTDTAEEDPEDKLTDKPIDLVEEATKESDTKIQITPQFEPEADLTPGEVRIVSKD